jgi:ABC-type lipoprotein export system ATPase subunit
MSELTLIIEGGEDKLGRAEPVDRVELLAGDVTAIVGPTGSGKTRLLADVERLTRGDSPTKRKVSLAGERQPAGEGRVARISQSMGFILDATAAEFLRMHAEFRGHAEVKSVEDEALSWANRICGESFDPDTPLAHLSGGQARALMVADTVIVSDCPVVLIDEIENAGIDRRTALDFLLSRGTITFIATHDPLIALQATRRIAMAQGAMSRVLERSAEEQLLLTELERQWEDAEQLQQRLRNGEPLR